MNSTFVCLATYIYIISWKTKMQNSCNICISIDLSVKALYITCWERLLQNNDILNTLETMLVIWKKNHLLFWWVACQSYVLLIWCVKLLECVVDAKHYKMCNTSSCRMSISCTHHLNVYLKRYSFCGILDGFIFSKCHVLSNFTFIY